MTIATEKVAQRFLNVTANVPLFCDWPLFRIEELEVRYGVDAFLAVYPQDYRVTLGSDFNTFTVTPLQPLLDKIQYLIDNDNEGIETNYITVRREMPLLTDSTPDKVSSTTYTSGELDRITMKLQQLQDQVERAFLLPPSYASDGTPLEWSTLLPNHSVMLSADYKRLVYGPSSADIAFAQQYAAETKAYRDEVADIVAGLGESVILGSAAYMDPEDTASTDDTAEFQAWVDALSQEGNAIGVLQGGRIYKVGQITVSKPIVISGAGGREQYDFTRNSWIEQIDPSKPLFKFNSSEARGAKISDVNIRQVHPDVTTPEVPGSWSPTVYAPVFDVQDMFGGITLENIFLYGVYDFVRVRNSGRMRLNNISGQVFNRLYDADQQFDSDRITQIHLWPFWNAGLAVLDYHQVTAQSAMRFGRCDTPFLDEIFIYAHSGFCEISGADLGAPSQGTTTRMRIGNVQLDGVPQAFYFSDGAFDAEVTYDQIDQQGEWFARPTPAPVLGVPGVWPIDIHASAGEVNLQGTHFRAEFVDGGILRDQSTLGAGRYVFGYLRGSTYNTGGAATGVFSANAVSTQAAEVRIGTELFLEGAAFPVDLVSGNLNLRRNDVEGGGSGEITDTLTSQDGTVTWKVDNDGQAYITDADLLSAASMGSDANLTGSPGSSIWEKTGTYDAWNYIEKRLAEISAGGSGDRITSPDTTVTARADNDGNLYLEDTDTSTAARLVSDGNVSASPGTSIWEKTGTYDAWNYVEKRLAEIAGGGSGDRIESPDGTVTARADNDGNLYVEDTDTSTASRLGTDGNVTGTPGSSVWDYTGTSDLANYLTKKFAEVGGGGSSDRIISPDSLSSITMVDGVGARLDNLETSIWTGDGNQTGSIYDDFGSATNVYDALVWVRDNAGGGGSGDRITSGSDSAIIVPASGLQVTVGANTATYQGYGNINAPAYDNNQNGGLGGTGTLVSYIEARIETYFNANIGGASVNYATTAGTASSASFANSATSASTATNATTATYLGGGTGIQNIGGALGVGAARYQTDGNVTGSAWSTWGSLYDAVIANSDRRAKKNIKDLEVGLEAVNRIPVYEYELKDNSLTRYGIMSDDLSIYAPDLIGKHKFNGMDTVDYQSLIGILWRAVQELSARMETA